LVAVAQQKSQPLNAGFFVAHCGGKGQGCIYSGDTRLGEQYSTRGIRVEIDDWENIQTFIFPKGDCPLY
jgi:hypothetical protein